MKLFENFAHIEALTSAACTPKRTRNYRILLKNSTFNKDLIIIALLLTLQLRLQKTLDFDFDKYTADYTFKLFDVRLDF